MKKYRISILDYRSGNTFIFNTDQKLDNYEEYYDYASHKFGYQLKQGNCNIMISKTEDTQILML